VGVLGVVLPGGQFLVPVPDRDRYVACLGSRARSGLGTAELSADQALVGCLHRGGIFDRLVVASHPDNLKSFATHDGYLAVASILTIVAAALAVLVVGRISGSNDRFRHSILVTA
jgi:hypothetical protein